MEFLNQVGRLFLVKMTRSLSLLIMNIRNAAVKRKIHAFGPYSLLNGAVLNVLYQEGIITTFSTKVDGGTKWLYEVKLRPDNYLFFKNIHTHPPYSAESEITYEYLKTRLINNVFFGILSTSEGVMSLRSAMSKKIGGKIILLLK